MSFKPNDVKILEQFIGFMHYFRPDGHLSDSGPGAKITNAEALECLVRICEMAKMGVKK